MAGDAFQAKVWALANRRQETLGYVQLESKLRIVQTRGDVRVGHGVDVRVHAQRNCGDLIALRSELRDGVDFRFAFDVHGANAGIERRHDFLVPFAHAAENDALRRNARAERARQLTAGYDVGAAAAFRKALENRQVSVGLDRVGDQHLACTDGRDRTVDGVVGFVDRASRVHVGRRTEALGDPGKGNAVAVQDAVHVREMGGEGHVLAFEMNRLALSHAEFFSGSNGAVECFSPNR